MQSEQALDTEGVQLDYWIEMCTASPLCIYYFGDFATYLEAEFAIAGYLEDLQKEGAKVISIQVKKCQPQKLILSADEIENLHLDFSHPKLKLNSNDS